MDTVVAISSVSGVRNAWLSKDQFMEVICKEEDLTVQGQKSGGYKSWGASLRPG